MGSMMGQSMSRADCGGLIERAAVTLKDIDQKWIDFDKAPRTHKNPIYSFMYQSLYRKLPKPEAEKKMPPVQKNDDAPKMAEKNEKTQKSAPLVVKKKPYVLEPPIILEKPQNVE